LGFKLILNPELNPYIKVSTSQLGLLPGVLVEEELNLTVAAISGRVTEGYIQPGVTTGRTCFEGLGVSDWERKLTAFI